MNLHSQLERALGLYFGTTPSDGAGPSWCTTDTGQRCGVALTGYGHTIYLFRVTARQQADSAKRQADAHLAEQVEGLRLDLVDAVPTKRLVYETQRISTDVACLARKVQELLDRMAESEQQTETRRLREQATQHSKQASSLERAVEWLNHKG